jgi:hypothetical protein
MPKAHTEWKVLPHGPIERLAENSWWAQGNLPGMTPGAAARVARRRTMQSL